MGPIAEQPRFLNAAAMAESALSPHELLRCLQEIESKMGLDRTTKVYQGPRRIDLDLLFVGELVRQEPELTLPHPRLTERRFVLQPLAELAPDFVHPLTGLTIRDHLNGLQS